jgi:hypothetical protein
MGQLVFYCGLGGYPFGYPLKLCVESMELLFTFYDLLPRPNIEVEHESVEVDIIREGASNLQAVEVCLHRMVQLLKEFRVLLGKVKI